MKNKKLYIIFSIIIVLLTFSRVYISIQNDTFSAIKIGNYILDNGLDFVEHFNIQEGLVYHNARYLFNILIALIYNGFNFFGVYLFTVIFSSAMFLILFNYLKKENNIVISFIITAFTIMISYPFLTARAQLVSYLLFMLEVIFIEQLLKTNKKRYIVYLFINSVLLANFHCTVWPVTMVLFLPYIAEYFISKIKLIDKSKRLYYSNINIKLLLIAFVLVAISGFATPLGLTPYTYMFKTMGGFSIEFISELQIPNFFKDVDYFTYFGIVILLLVYLKGKIKISDLFMIIGLFILSSICYRNISFLYFVAPISIARLIKDCLKKHEDNIEIITGYYNKANYLLIITLIVGIAISGIYYSIIMKQTYISKSFYPVEATKYIKKNIDTDNMRIFNDFNVGTYLEFNDIKVFLDSRSEVFCEEFNDTTALKDWYNVTYGIKNYNEIFDKYNFTHILLYKESLIDNYIKYDENYKEIYKDEYFVLYEKIN